MITEGRAPAARSDLLTVLQFGDSFFPSGATAFSWSLESLCLDGLVVNAVQIDELLQTLIEGRWAGFDRPLLLAAHATGDVDELAWTGALRSLDRLCEAMTLNEGARAASRRLGATQLKVHSALGLRAAQAYLDEIDQHQAPGHLPIVQGLLGRALCLSAADCEAMSAFGQCVSVVGAAIRLGVIGHLDGQRLLSAARDRIAAVQAMAVPALYDLWNAAPGVEIAAMRHEPRRARMFAN